MLHVRGKFGTSRIAAIQLATLASFERQFSDSPINRQRRFLVGLLRFPSNGLSHSWPPHKSYIELGATTATKCSDCKVLSKCELVLDSSRREEQRARND